MDLTRLLPHTFEELEEDKRSLGKWTISFKLTGKAKGAVLNKLDEGHFGDLKDFNFYYEHLEPHKPPGGSSLESGGESNRNESNDTEFTLIEQGIEYSTNDTVKLEDVVDSVDGSDF
ncbi:hypothetical protein LguiA_030298 [Lonicera macranthoides]